MSSQISDTADSITLNFDVGTEHLANERLKTAQFDYEKLIIG